MAAARHRSPAARLVAWLYTGPLGHLYGGAADVTELLWRLTRERARHRAGSSG